MNNWLFLRGEIKSGSIVDNDHDMWIQLFNELKRGDNGEVWFKGQNVPRETNIVFARGGFDYYIPILKQLPNSYKIRYGAGRRYMPESEIKYDLVLVDTENQKKEVLNKYPEPNVHLLIKPAAQHFEYIETKKEYDVCFIARHKADFKGIKWVYANCPRDISILHLGGDINTVHPSNVTIKLVDRKDMPLLINQCKVGIVPYEDVDSCPRVIPEMLACGLPLVISEKTNVSHRFLFEFLGNNRMFVAGVKMRWVDFFDSVKTILSEEINYQGIEDFYCRNLSIPISANHLRECMK